jgi:hypothetical protein
LFTLFQIFRDSPYYPKFAGGFLFLVARGAGDWSLDAKRERLTSPSR